MMLRGAVASPEVASNGVVYTSSVSFQLPMLRLSQLILTVDELLFTDAANVPHTFPYQVRTVHQESTII
jgi:hypothetical protein